MNDFPVFGPGEKAPVSAVGAEKGGLASLTIYWKKEMFSIAPTDLTNFSGEITINVYSAGGKAERKFILSDDSRGKTLRLVFDFLTANKNENITVTLLDENGKEKASAGFIEKIEVR